MFMENYSKTMNEMIERTLALYDFNKTEELMSKLGWKWLTGVDTLGLPTQHDMWKMARDLLKEAYDNQCSIASGGFEARYESGELSLRFIPVESITNTADIDDANDEVEVSGVPYKVPKSSVKARKKK